ncbi:TetR-like C-terminal domain-containing protein [Bacillus pumilus]|uniref:TetR-like C-terminal domain-containing protein n=2 Tax=Bacillales TaxID=1385 RepID=UPI0037097135
MISYLAAANLSLIQHWLENGMTEQTSTISLMITNIVGSAVKNEFIIEPSS